MEMRTPNKNTHRGQPKTIVHFVNKFSEIRLTHRIKYFPSFLSQKKKNPKLKVWQSYWITILNQDHCHIDLCKYRYFPNLCQCTEKSGANTRSTCHFLANSCQNATVWNDRNLHKVSIHFISYQRDQKSLTTIIILAVQNF